MSSPAVESGARPRAGGRRASVGALTRRVPATKWQTLLAVLVYFAFACFMTWPLVTGLSHIIYGAAGDPFGTMAFYRALVSHGHNPFLPGTISQFSAPEGQPIPWPRDLAALPGVLSFYALTAAFGAVRADGLYILLGFTLSGTAMFLLVRRLTSDVWASLVSGWAFAFYPFAIINGQGHLDLIQGWVLVLGVWRMLELMWKPTARNGMLAGLAVAFGMWWTPYFILLAGVAFAALTVVGALVNWRGGRLRAAIPSYAAALGVVIVFAGFLAWLSTQGAASSIGIRTNGVQELNTYSARPLEYLLPDAESPLFGKDTQHYLLSHLHGSNPSEATLYVGVSVVALALIAFVLLLRRRFERRQASAVIALLVVVLAAAIVSAPPQVRVFGVLVSFPSHYISLVTSTWRVYARLVVIVMLALSALAGLALSGLARGSARWRVAVMLLASIVVPLDLWARLGGRTNELEPPKIYHTLARQPPGLVAEYPLTPSGYNNYGDVFYQSVYEKPIVGGYLEGSFEEHRALSLANLADPGVAGRLATLGVRYVLVDAAPPGYGLPSAGVPGRGFRLIEAEPYASLYRVTAAPTAVALAAVGEGFSDSESTPQGVANWMVQPTGKIEVTGSCTSCTGRLEMTLSSFARARLVTLRAGGKVLFSRRVVAPTRVSIPLAFKRHAELTLAAAPGPQSVQQTIGGPDPRSVDVQVIDPQVLPLAGEAAHRGRGRA